MWNRTMSRVTRPHLQRFLFHTRSSSSIAPESRMKTEKAKIVVISTGKYQNQAASIAIITSQKSGYIFNAPEGTQLFLNLLKIKVAEIHQLFLTSFQWKNISGIQGIFCNSDLMTNKFHRMFVHTEEENALQGYMGQDVSGVYRNTDFEDDYVYIKKFSFAPSETEKSDGNYYIKSTGYIVWIRKRPKQSEGVMDMYDLERLLAPSMVSKRDFQKENKEDNSPKDEENDSNLFLEKDEYVRPIIVLECPSKEYIKEMMSQPTLKSFWNSKSHPPPSLVVHMTPDDVAKCPEYIEFMNKFSSDSMHWVLNENCYETMKIRTSIFMQALRNICPQVFCKIPYFEELHEQFLSKNKPFNNLRNDWIYKNDRICNIPQFAVYSVLGDELFPSVGCSNHQFLKRTHEFVERLKLNPTVGEDLENCQKLFLSSDACPTDTQDYPVLHILGTGSAAATWFRALSGYLLENEFGEYILMDCGPCTLERMQLMFGDDIDRVVRNLKTIFLSHSHGDHYLGLVSLLLKRHQVFQEAKEPVPQIHIIASPWLQHYLEVSYQKLFPEEMKQIRLTTLKKRFGNTDVAVEGAKKFTAVPVDHDLRLAYACYICFHNDRSIFFSGDCSPTDFSKFFKNVDVLIHEATQSKKNLIFARNSNHCTTTEAVEMGKKMRAELTLLTHFSNRYGLLNVGEKEIASEAYRKVAIAMDMMTFHMGHLQILPALNTVYLPLNKVWRKEKELFMGSNLLIHNILGSPELEGDVVSDDDDIERDSSVHRSKKSHVKKDQYITGQHKSKKQNKWRGSKSRNFHDSNKSWTQSWQRSGTNAQK